MNKESLAKALLVSLMLPLAGCIFVREKNPNTVSTTTTTHRATAPVPETTTVERTTVY